MRDNKYFITTWEDLFKIAPQVKKYRKISKNFPPLISKQYFDLTDWEKLENCPIFRQAVPSVEEEKDDPQLPYDSLGEEKYSIFPYLVHKYTNRVLLLLTNECYTKCRFCTRRRIVYEDNSHLLKKTFDLYKVKEYLKNNKQINDVIVSGGDPLTLGDDELEEILLTLTNIDTIKTIRIGTRAFLMYPERVTQELLNIFRETTLKKTLYIMHHFNHPRELEPPVIRAVLKEAQFASSAQFNQTVLLKGINDTVEILKDLFTDLQALGIKPYYLFHCDYNKFISHFRVPIKRGREIMQALRQELSLLTTPRYVQDTEKGKFELFPQREKIIDITRKV
jgi:lysine 2,3-aminomutase